MADEPIAPILGRALNLARRSRGLSQQEVGEALGTTQATVSAWERGKLRPNLEQLISLTHVLGANRTALLDAVEAEMADRGQIPQPLTPKR